jgi:hypothetical protein
MIYGVFTGEYSDWDVIGYFKTEAEAEAYCKRRNEGKIGAYDQYYVLPMIDLSAVPYEGKRIPYEFDPEKGKVSRYYWSFKEGVPEDGIIVTKNMFGETVAIVWAYPAEADKIVKIARDRYAMYKAREEGIV